MHICTYIDVDITICTLSKSADNQRKSLNKGRALSEDVVLVKTGGTSYANL